MALGGAGGEGRLTVSAPRDHSCGSVVLDCRSGTDAVMCVEWGSDAGDAGED